MVWISAFTMLFQLTDNVTHMIFIKHQIRTAAKATVKDFIGPHCVVSQSAMLPS